MTLELTLVVYPHAEGAERAYADAHGADRDAPWTQEVAFVEHHRHDRIVVRGAVAGHYVDVDDRGDVIGSKTSKGALTGAAVGVLFGPAGLAAGLVAGATIGGIATSDSAPALHDAFIDEVRADVPQGSSAIILLAAPDHVDTMVKALDGSGGEVSRHPLSEAEAEALARAVANDPEISA
jgi:uncharacterized membrane protein